MSLIGKTVIASAACGVPRMRGRQFIVDDYLRFSTAGFPLSDDYPHEFPHTAPSSPREYDGVYGVWYRGRELGSGMSMYFCDAEVDVIHVGLPHEQWV